MESAIAGGVKAGTAEVGGAVVIVGSEGQASGVNILQNKEHSGWRRNKAIQEKYGKL